MTALRSVERDQLCMFQTFCCCFQLFWHTAMIACTYMVCRPVVCSTLWWTAGPLNTSAVDTYPTPTTSMPTWYTGPPSTQLSASPHPPSLTAPPFSQRLCGCSRPSVGTCEEGGAGERRTPVFPGLGAGTGGPVCEHGRGKVPAEVCAIRQPR